MGDNPLGKPATYPAEYDPSLLHAIARQDGRSAAGIPALLPFHGEDIWNAWELSWLHGGGCPVNAIAEIRVPAISPHIVESKSLKLYLGAFAMTTFSSADAVQATIASDLAAVCGAPVGVRLDQRTDQPVVRSLPGDCIDVQAIHDFDTRDVDDSLLSANAGELVQEKLHSHLLRSLCPVTNQPDTGSILICYDGPLLDRAALLRYLVSYRQHNDFHESCVERIFVDLMRRCEPQALTVYARYNRRGGIDINPFRSNFEHNAENIRLWRQ